MVFVSSLLMLLIISVGVGHSGFFLELLVSYNSFSESTGCSWLNIMLIALYYLTKRNYPL